MHLKRAIKLIGQSDLVDLIEDRRKKYKRPEIDEILVGDLSEYPPMKLYEVARKYFRKRVPEFEPYMINSVMDRTKYYSPKALYLYAYNIIKGPWPEAEEALMGYDKSDYMYSIKYAKNVLRGRWPELEQRILGENNADAAYNYAREILKGRWPEAEPVIMKDPWAAFYYIKDVIKSRWPEAEPYIKKNSYFWEKYQKEFGLED